jgi:hypothetical protein
MFTKVHFDSSDCDVVLRIADLAHGNSLELPFLIALSAKPRSMPIINIVDVVRFPPWLLGVELPGWSVL